ncbi:hypothetical protein DPMN_108318 [Dreissena polymorpha]|uniref:Uncharacterized protein n=1 Tax=Dreissena polymorpha TaxID=45954 RepID=A0A9D4K8M7_DREPO|nr:hypothetical protein DPMN_108318 [Dreissena polymorpha]
MSSALTRVAQYVGRFAGEVDAVRRLFASFSDLVEKGSILGHGFFAMAGIPTHSRLHQVTLIVKRLKIQTSLG